MPHYYAMVKSFSPNEMKIMLELPSSTTIVAGRLKTSRSCEKRFTQLVGLLDKSSVPTLVKAAIKKWLPKVDAALEFP